jgi:hypothetical protein
LSREEAWKQKTAKQKNLPRPVGALSSLPTALLQLSAREGEVSGGYPGYVAKTSLFTTAYVHPIKTALFTLGALGATAVLLATPGRLQK